MKTRKRASNMKPYEIFEKSDIQPSFHRIRILEYLKEKRTHPTVSEIYKDLSKEIPTISKTTIYNTLKLFVSKNIVKEIPIESNEMRYDIITKPHAHFKCKVCGRIYDIDFKLNIPSKVRGHEIQEYDVFLKGICKDCLKKEGNK